MLDDKAIITLDLLPTPATGSSGGYGRSNGSNGSSLFGLLDRTASAAGSRKLRQWLCR